MLYDKKICLDPRLSRIAEMLGKCASCADIGSDHGRLGAFLLQNDRCERICLTDISAPSLDKARKLIRMLGLEDRAHFYVGDGAQILSEKVEAAVIAGMGGETIAHIIENAQGKLDGARLVLQPNVAAPELRRRLNQVGWMIDDEALLRDGRRIYMLICARQGEQRLTDMEYEVGPVLMQKKPELMKDYREFRLRVAKTALQGAQQGSRPEAIEALQREISIWEEAGAWL